MTAGSCVVPDGDAPRPVGREGRGRRGPGRLDGVLGWRYDAVMSDPHDQPPRPRPFRFAAIIFTLCALVTGGALAGTFPEQRWWVLGGVVVCLLLIALILALVQRAQRQH